MFCDEFTNYQDLQIGQKTVLLLEALGYDVLMPMHAVSGRTFLSKGFVRKAKEIARTNIDRFAPLISAETPLVGIEPSAILTFRDEYIDLADESRKSKARHIAAHCFTLEEFLSAKYKAGEIPVELFTDKPAALIIHGHCYQKSLSNQQDSLTCLQIPVNYKAQLLPTGCCGMAGSFGYEKEHFQLSQQVGELVLFPALRNNPTSTIVVAAGTSCRHQIKDGVQQTSKHPAEVLFEALVHKPTI